MGVIVGSVITGKYADGLQPHYAAVAQNCRHHSDKTTFIGKPHDMAQRILGTAAAQHFEGVRHYIHALSHRQPLVYFLMIDHKNLHSIHPFSSVFTKFVLVFRD